MFRIGDRVKVNAPSLKSHGVCGIATSNPGDLISGLTTVRLDNGQNITIKDSKLVLVNGIETTGEFARLVNDKKFFVIFEYEVGDYLPVNVEALANDVEDDIPVDTWYGRLKDYVNSQSFHELIMDRGPGEYVAVYGDEIYHLRQTASYTVEEVN